MWWIRKDWESADLRQQWNLWEGFEDFREILGEEEEEEQLSKMVVSKNSSTIVVLQIGSRTFHSVASNLVEVVAWEYLD